MFSYDTKLELVRTTSFSKKRKKERKINNFDKAYFYKICGRRECRPNVCLQVTKICVIILMYL
jgi:hypothetical protein